jgi:hypothetical protein
VRVLKEGEFKTVNVMLVKWNGRSAAKIGVGEMLIEVM